MDDKGAQIVIPTLQPQDVGMNKNPWIEDEQFNSGYLARSKHLMPKQGDHVPWTFSGDYYLEKDELPKVDLNEPELVYHSDIESAIAAQ